MVRTYYIDDSQRPTTLKIKDGKEMVIEKSFVGLSLCLRWLYHNSRNTKTQQMVEELVSMKQWIQGNKFKFRKKVAV